MRLLFQETQDDEDYRRLRLMGEFALGLEDDYLDKLSPRAVMQNLGFIGTLPFTYSQAHKLMEKLEAAMP
jgi:hypothetical protein